MTTKSLDFVEEITIAWANVFINRLDYFYGTEKHTVTTFENQVNDVEKNGIKLILHWRNIFPKIGVRFLREGTWLGMHIMFSHIN